MKRLFSVLIFLSLLNLQGSLQAVNFSFPASYYLAVTEKASEDFMEAALMMVTVYTAAAMLIVLKKVYDGRKTVIQNMQQMGIQSRQAQQLPAPSISNLAPKTSK